MTTPILICGLDELHDIYASGERFDAIISTRDPPIGLRDQGRMRQLQLSLQQLSEHVHTTLRFNDIRGRKSTEPGAPTLGGGKRI
jgi:hypothetical protein